MKGNVIVALIVGAVLGFVVGRATSTGGAPGAAPSGGPAPLAAAPSGPSSDQGKTPADLPPNYLKESDLPAGSLAGLSEAQKYSALKAANEVNCDCGCQNDTVAKCRKDDPSCPRAPTMLTNIVDLARQGKSSDQIKSEAGKSKPAQPSRPTEDPTAVFKVPIGDAPCKGPKTARVTLVESTDFQ